jgi:hypothetical protein
VAATGRYLVASPSLKGGWLLLQQEVQHKQHGYNLAVFAIEKERYLRHPLGRLKGPAQLQVDFISDYFRCLVMVYAHEWEALTGNPDAQRAHIDQLLQQAEAAIAAAQEQQQGTGRDGSESTVRQAPIITGLLPQDHPPQAEADTQQENSTGSAATTRQEPPQPVLTPAEAEARFKALQQQALQQQQAFLQGLPPAPASGLNWVKSPGQQPQQRQQQQVLKPPQAPALKPPRRPGA